MDVEMATSSGKSLHPATVNSTSSAEEVPPKCLCWCQLNNSRQCQKSEDCSVQRSPCSLLLAILLTTVYASKSPRDLRSPQFYFNARNSRPDLFVGYEFIGPVNLFYDCYYYLCYVYSLKIGHSSVYHFYSTAYLFKTRNFGQESQDMKSTYRRSI